MKESHSAMVLTLGKRKAGRPRKDSGKLQDVEKMLALYDELIFAVESKFTGETRHQTALRYIKEREQCRQESGLN